MIRLLENIKARRLARERVRQELEADYFARALLMPKESIAKLMIEYDFYHLSPEKKQEFIRHISNVFRVPVQHAELRVKEVNRMYLLHR